MPTRPKTFRPPGALTRQEIHRQHDRQRGTANQRGYTYRWQQASKLFLQQHPLCAECERQGRVTEATVVDHKKAHRGDMVVFWNVDNWEALCKPCHDEKTARGE